MYDTLSVSHERRAAMRAERARIVRRARQQWPGCRIQDSVHDQWTASVQVVTGGAVVADLTVSPDAARLVPQGYTVRGEWGGYTVRRARTGWVVEQWSAIQGSETGGRYLIRYDTPALHVERAQDLAAVVDVWDVPCSRPAGQRLYEIVCEQGIYSRVLRRPVRVQ